MKTTVLTCLLLSICIVGLRAQGPNGNDFGFGIILGEPIGGTVKIWTARDQAVAASIGGNSYFGNLRIGADYLWHFDVFRSQVVKMYSGPGLVVGFGEGHDHWFHSGHGHGNGHGHDDHFYFRDEGGVGFAARVVAGLNIVPKRTPVELFLEIGPLIGISPFFGVAVDGAIGIRFYP